MGLFPFFEIAVPTLTDYTVEVTNRYNGLDLIVSDELYVTEVRDIVEETGMKTNPKKKKSKKAKWLSEAVSEIFLFHK